MIFWQKNQSVWKQCDKDLSISA